MATPSFQFNSMRIEKYPHKKLLLTLFRTSSIDAPRETGNFRIAFTDLNNVLIYKPSEVTY